MIVEIWEFITGKTASRLEAANRKIIDSGKPKKPNGKTPGGKVRIAKSSSNGGC